MIRRTLPLILLILTLPTTLPAADAPVIREGWDWTLPAHVQPVDYSGYFTWGGRRFDPAITVRGVMVTWARLNPAPGKYDWNWLREEIAKNKAAATLGVIRQDTRPGQDSVPSLNSWT